MDILSTSSEIKIYNLIKTGEKLDNSIVILCGGLGNRLRSIIFDKPKVLAKVGDDIFLDIVIKNVLQYGYRDVILCTGYLKEKIRDYLNNHSDYKTYNIKFSEEKDLLGTGGALKNAKYLIASNNFLVINGDSICKTNLKDFFDFHINKNALLSIVLSKSSLDQSNKDYGSVVLDNLQRITNFNEKLSNTNQLNHNAVSNGEQLMNAGIYLMNKEIFSLMPKKDKFSLEYDLFPEIIKTNNCYGFITNSEIIDIGIPERYKRAQEYCLGDIIMMNDIDENIIKNLEEKAKKIRRHMINMVYEAGSGHPGGSLSCIDIIITLYFHIMRHNPLDPKWEDRDRFILSKGHAAPTLYATLAYIGYFPIEELSSLRKIGGTLQGHSDYRTPGVEVSAGSLGQGLSVASGIAYVGKLDKKDFKVYILLGDGECNEGQIWEAAMFASHYKLNNLVAIIDRNSFQIDGPTEKIMSLEPFDDKWVSFGWNVIKINGNNIHEIIMSLDRAKIEKEKPTVIIANTIKGKGISFMEKNNEFHGKVPNEEEMKIALLELDDHGTKIY